MLSRKQTGEQFLRQRPIKSFIVDFFATEIGLIIEIEGNSRFNKGDYDRRRENELRTFGYELIRFSEEDVISNLDVVHEKVIHAIHCRKNLLIEVE